MFTFNVSVRFFNVLSLCFKYRFFTEDNSSVNNYSCIVKRNRINCTINCITQNTYTTQRVFAHYAKKSIIGKENIIMDVIYCVYI